MTASTTKSALLVVGITAASIFFAEIIVMLILSLFPPLATGPEAILDAFMLAILVFPILYFFLFRPLVREINIRSVAEDALNIEKKRAQEYFDVAGAMLLILDNDGKIELLNNRASEILGCPASAALGRDWVETFVPNRYREEVLSVLKLLLSGEESIAEYYENPVVTADGRERMIAWHNIILKDTENNITSILCSGEDITERKRSEVDLRKAHGELEERVRERTEELTDINEKLEKEFAEHKRAVEARKESELKFRSVTQSANDAIISADSEGNILGWNNGAKRIFGYSEAEVNGKSLTMLMPERYREDHLKGIARVARTGESEAVGKTLELHGLKKDLGEFPLELSLSTWKSARGVFYTGIIRDATERKRIEEEREGIQTQLLHSQRLEAIGRLIVGVAHDFSNISLSIKGYAYTTLKRLDKENPLAKNMQQILSLVDRGSEVTRQLVQFGRDDPVNFVELDMNDTAEALLKMIANLIKPNIVVESELAKDLWHVYADRGNMDQVLMNLVVNASDAMEETGDGGTLTIRTANVAYTEEEARIRPEIKPGNFVCVSVSDTGTGMDKSVIDRIFDPFFTTKGDKGSGLGLSVVYGIVNRHKGWIDVDSKADEGTTITYCVPAYSKDPQGDLGAS